MVQGTPAGTSRMPASQIASVAAASGSRSVNLFTAAGVKRRCLTLTAAASASRSGALLGAGWPAVPRRRRLGVSRHGEAPELKRLEGIDEEAKHSQTNDSDTGA